MCGVDGVVVEPRLRIVEVNDMFSQLVEDEVDVLEMQLGINALLRLDAYPPQRLQHLPHLLLSLRHH
jgi:predicted component of type VI protein secretion system